MRYIYKKQKLDENETRKFMRQIVSAVDHLHKAGIIHRYVTLMSIMLGSMAYYSVFLNFELYTVSGPH